MFSIEAILSFLLKIKHHLVSNFLTEYLFILFHKILTLLVFCMNKMASSDPEIKDGFTLPVWMKSKPTKEFEPFAASPPAPEDSFFYIRYPKTNVRFGQTKYNQENVTQIISENKEVTAATTYNIVKEKDWSKHTKSCQDVLHGIAPINTAANSVTAKPKPAGIDDGFKGEGAACGTSVVKVAHQMISTSRPSRGFTLASPDDDTTAPDMQQYNLMARRGSKSLPATPAHSPNSSPTSRRKMNGGNRYFTAPFEPIESSGHRSWLSTALLGFKKDLATSTSTLAEEDALEVRLQGGVLAESVESLGPAPKGKDPTKLSPSSESAQQPKVTKPSNTFLPKPSELREMNFWSPTSM